MEDNVFHHTPIRCLEFWFEDGDTMMTAGHVGFRIHKYVLSGGSSVLADMGRSDEDQLAGCPTVRLEESAHDVKHLLRMLYNGVGEGEVEPVRLPECADFTSNVRMAHKYKLHIRKETYCLLRHRFPSTFTEWETRGGLSAGDAIEAISLFRTIGDDDLTTPHMVVALYLACGLPYRALLHGHRRTDGVLERLHREDIERCVLLRESLVERSAWMAAKLYEGEASANCVGTDGQCDAGIASVRTSILRGSLNHWLHADPLGEFMQSRVDEMEVESARGICGICAGMLCERERQLRRELWEALPSMLAGVEDEMKIARGGRPD
ncbi:hypothetical protein BD309DRAFT_964957 [Dichomitus squalens]|nr:hypothetical protein BD309DRAFT_964957 [Dichomitus squalens]